MNKIHLVYAEETISLDLAYHDISGKEKELLFPDKIAFQKNDEPNQVYSIEVDKDMSKKFTDMINGYEQKLKAMKDNCDSLVTTARIQGESAKIAAIKEEQKKYSDLEKKCQTLHDVVLAELHYEVKRLKLKLKNLTSENESDFIVDTPE